MRLPTGGTVTAGLLWVLQGCVVGGAALPQSRTANGMTAVTVLEATELSGAGGSLLGALRASLTGAQMRETPGGCPQITLRGTRSLVGGNNPVVYVDGTRAINTCILDNLLVADVRRVEVYQGGIPPRPPYQASPNGLILVFLLNGSGR